MLNQTELERLFEVLSYTDKTFENIYALYTEYFSNDSFKVNFVLTNLLSENLLCQNARFIAFYLIYESFQIKINPFLSALIDFCENTVDAFEKRFLYEILLKGTKELSKENIKNIFQQREIEYDLQFEVKDKEDFLALKKTVYDFLPDINNFNKTNETLNVVSDFNLTDESQSFPPDHFDLNSQCFGLDFMRPVPVPIELNEEYIWLNPGNVLDFCWDYKMGNNTNLQSMVKELMQKSFQTQLTPNESTMLIEALDKDPKLIHNCGLAPQFLPDFVEKNSNIASIALNHLAASPSINLYYEKLATMELTLQSLEVVNKLANSVDLPKEFLTYYITHCIQQIEESKKDKNMQNRLVRLVCVFIKSLIKSKIINPKDMFIELQAFCIDYGKVGEATVLFKMLKQLDAEKKD